MHRGDIYWHALPFNGQLEFFDVSLLEFAVQMTHEIDVKFGLAPKRTMSQVIPTVKIPADRVNVVPTLDACLDARLDQELSHVCQQTACMIQSPDAHMRMSYMVLHMHSTP